MKSDGYYIQHGWAGDLAVWWRPDAAGYTVYLDDAGVYSEEYVRARRWRRQDVARPKAEVDAVITRRPIVVGSSQLPNEPEWVRHES